MEFYIYFLEDDDFIYNILNTALQSNDYILKGFKTGKDLFKEINNNIPKILLLDLMLPDTSGQEVIKKIRSNKFLADIEIIVISAKNLLHDKINILNIGADDFIEKPFDIDYLLSKINARVRKYKKNNIFIIDNLYINLDNKLIKKDNEEIILTNKEFDILKYLLLNANQNVSRTDLYLKIWGCSDIATRTLDMHIKSIREKIKVSKDFIKTIHGYGYKVIL